MILEPEDKTKYGPCPSNRLEARWLFRRAADRGHPTARGGGPQGTLPTPSWVGLLLSTGCALHITLNTPPQ